MIIIIIIIIIIITIIVSACIAGENPAVDRLRAAHRLVENHEAVVKFAARGCGQPGSPPVNAPLSDPNAKPGMQYIDAVDAGEWSVHDWLHAAFGKSCLCSETVDMPALACCGMHQQLRVLLTLMLTNAELSCWLCIALLLPVWGQSCAQLQLCRLLLFC